MGNDSKIKTEKDINPNFIAQPTLKFQDFIFMYNPSFFFLELPFDPFTRIVSTSTIETEKGNSKVKSSSLSKRAF